MTGAELFRYVLAAFVFFILPAGAVSPAPASEEAPAAWMEASLETLAPGSSQALLVTGIAPSGSQATLQAMEKKGTAWRAAFPPVPALIGENGFAPSGSKREGDVRTPSGVFALKRTFGYSPQIRSRMPYRSVDKDDLWVDDISSADYNQWVRRGSTSASSFEVMKLDDIRYKYGIVVEYNTGPVVRGAGSAIFIHVRLGKHISTRGCVALSQEEMMKILAWLDPAANPVAVLGTRDSLVTLTRNALLQSAGQTGRAK